jgi:flagellar biogenesis protein FliO
MILSLVVQHLLAKPILHLPSQNFLPGISSLAYGAGVLFLVCVGAFLALKFLYGKNMFNRLGLGRQMIKIVDRFPLAPQRYILIIEVLGKFYLIGTTEQNINFLTQLNEEALAKEMGWMEQNHDGPASFTNYLNALSKRWKKNRKDVQE